MSATEARTIVTGVDFVSIPTSDLERAVAFYGETLGLLARPTAPSGTSPSSRPGP